MVWVWAEGHQFWNQEALDPYSKGRALFYHLVENCKFQTTMAAHQIYVSHMAVSKATWQFKEVLTHDKKLQKKIQSLKFKVET